MAAPGLQHSRAAAMMRPMTDDRAWFASYPPDVPHSLAPYPKEPLYSCCAARLRASPTVRRSRSSAPG